MLKRPFFVATVMVIVFSLVQAPSFRPADAAAGDDGVTDVDMSGSSVCAIKSGALYCWGENYNGILGVGDTTQRLTPTPVTGMGSGVQAISSDGTTACAIKSGALYCWGRSSAIGDGSTNPYRYYPVAIPGLSAGVTQVSTSILGTCAIKSGALYCWGNNSNGAVGDGTKSLRLSPVLVSGMTSGVSFVRTNGFTTCAIKSGALYCWGINANAIFGDGTRVDKLSPTATPGLNADVTSFTYSSGTGTCAVKAGALYCWGLNSRGDVGDGTSTDRFSPVAISGFESGVSYVENSHNCVIKTGTVYCWGYRYSTYVEKSASWNAVPTLVSGASGEVTSLSEGLGDICVIKAAAVLCWGDDGVSGQRATPTMITGLETGVSMIKSLSNYTTYPSYGTDHCAIQNSSLYCWGKNHRGLLGDGSTDASATPKLVVFSTPPPTTSTTTTSSTTTTIPRTTTTTTTVPRTTTTTIPRTTTTTVPRTTTTTVPATLQGPANFKAVLKDQHILLTASAVKGASLYVAERGGVEIGRNTRPEFWDINRASVAGTYTFTMKAINSQGGVGNPSSKTVSVSPPAAPPTLVSSSSLKRMLTVTVSMGADVKTWKLLRNGIVIGSWSATTKTVKVSQPLGTYTFTLAGLNSTGYVFPVGSFSGTFS